MDTTAFIKADTLEERKQACLESWAHTSYDVLSDIGKDDEAWSDLMKLLWDYEVSCYILRTCNLTLLKRIYRLMYTGNQWLRALAMARGCADLINATAYPEEKDCGFIIHEGTTYARINNAFYTVEDDTAGPKFFIVDESEVDETLREEGTRLMKPIQVSDVEELSRKPEDLNVLIALYPKAIIDYWNVENWIYVLARGMFRPPWATIKIDTYNNQIRMLISCPWAAYIIPHHFAWDIIVRRKGVDADKLETRPYLNPVLYPELFVVGKYMKTRRKVTKVEANYDYSNI